MTVTKHLILPLAVMIAASAPALAQMSPAAGGTSAPSASATGSVNTNASGTAQGSDYQGMNTGAAASTSTAAPRSTFRMPTFKKLDADSNGTITSQEFATSGVQNSDETFQSLDTNHDGVLSRSELRSYRAGR